MILFFFSFLLFFFFLLFLSLFFFFFFFSFFSFLQFYLSMVEAFYVEQNINGSYAYLNIKVNQNMLFNVSPEKKKKEKTTTPLH